MRIYHDWEFLETGNSIYPISVGMVTEDGRELYLEFSNVPWEKVQEHEWLMENVVPKLGSYSFSPEYIQMAVREFLHKTFRISGRIELWGWYSSYDHVCLSQLFGAMVNLPSFVPMWTNDMKQEVMRLGNPTIPDMREQGEIVHHALDDARAEKRMGDWLQQYAQGGKMHKRRPTYRDPIFMED